jgi:hypothetical protein
MSKAALLKRVFLLTLAVAGAVALYLLSYCVACSIGFRCPNRLSPYEPALSRVWEPYH